MRRFWNWFSTNLGIHDLRGKQLATQRHCHALEQRLAIMESLVVVGADIHSKTDSWMVMSIAGKPEYVEFFKLPSEELKYLQLLFKEMEKRYGHNNIRVDVPPHARHFFNRKAPK